MKLNIPSFGRKRALLEPVQFVPISKAFEPQVEVVMHNDVSGWLKKKSDRLRFSFSAGKRYTISEAKAREFVAKGYASYVDPRNDDISDDERAEFKSQVTVLSLGA